MPKYTIPINRSIREQMAGGRELLDLIELVHQMVRRGACPQVILDRLIQIKNVMAQAIVAKKETRPVGAASQVRCVGTPAKVCFNPRREATVEVSPTSAAPSRMPYDDDAAPLSPRRTSPDAVPPPAELSKAPVHAVKHFASELPDTDRRQHTGVGVIWHAPASIVARMGKETDSAIAADAGVSETSVREARQRLDIKAFMPRWSEADDAIVMTLPVDRAAAALGRSVASVKTRKTRIKKAVQDAE